MLKFFPEAVFLGVAMEWLQGNEDVWSPVLEHRLKRGQVLIRTLNHAQNFPDAVFLGLAMEWLLGDEDVWSVKL